MIALAAADWRDRRSQAETAGASVVFLLDDLARDSAALATVAARQPRRDARMAEILLNVGDPDFPEDSAVSLLIGLAAEPIDFAPARSAFEALIQSDGLRYIGPPELQARVSNYFERRQPEVAAVHEAHVDRLFELQSVVFPYNRLSAVLTERGFGLLA